MIEGMFVFSMGIGTGIAVTMFYLGKKTNDVTPHANNNPIDASKFLAPNKKYYTNKSFDEEGGK